MRYKEFSRIGVAVVGTGFIGPVHIEALRRLGLNVTGVLGSDPDKSRAARERLGLAKAYASMNELLADKSVDAVHIAVPNIHHHEMAKQALLARKHVLCEKPLAMNSRESLELVRLSQAQGVAAGIAYNVRFYPLNLEARERVQRGDAGVVISVNGAYVQDWLLHDTDYNWRVLADQGGELRAVADIGTHWIDLVTSITGLEVEKLFADLATVHKARLRPRGEVETFTGKLKNERPALSSGRESVVVTTEDCGNVLFRFRGGARGSLHVSQVTAGRKNSIGYEIAGSKCALAWRSEEANELWIGHRDRPNERLTRDPALVGALPRRFSDYPGGHDEGFPDTFKQCFRAFYESILAGDFASAPLFPTFQDGHREIILCEAILRSHREEKWITI